MCKVLLIDLEGKADGRALQTIIPHINPKTVVSDTLTSVFLTLSLMLSFFVLFGERGELTKANDMILSWLLFDSRC